MKYFALFFGSLFPVYAYAYLDPGTGSMLLSAVVGIIATLLFSFKAYFYKLKGLYYQLRGEKIEKKDISLVFYSEGGQYWSTFSLVLDELESREIQAMYLTSDKDDPVFTCDYKYIESKFIGEGNRAYTYLNLLEAKVCVLTTPGLDVLQIKRSKGVRHYSHLVHAPTDMGLYTLYSFDYYDSVLCAGTHQIKSLRALEDLRSTPKKDLYESGCVYIDYLKEKLDVVEGNDKNEEITVLLAPTWGVNGLLSRFGEEIIQNLVSSGLKTIIRPHPQSYISEIDLMDRLEARFPNSDLILWDKTKDNFDSLYNSSILISDLSGIIFDYLYVFEKPVLAIKQDLDLRRMDAQDLPEKMWELRVLDNLNSFISQSDIKDIPKLVKKYSSDPEYLEKIKKLREDYLYNYGNSKTIVVDNLIEILEGC